jgi:hypothetical protein
MKEARAMTELRAIAGGAGAARRKEFHDQSGGAIVIALVMKDQFDRWLRPRAERGERTAEKLLHGLYGSEIDLREGATHKCLFCDDRCSKDNPPGATVLIQPDNEEAPPALGCGYFVCRACAQPRDDLKDRVLARFRTPSAGFSHIRTARVLTAKGEESVPLLGLQRDFDVDTLLEFTLDPAEVATLYAAIRSFKGEKAAALALWEKLVREAHEAADTADNQGRRLATCTIALVKVWFEVIADETAPIEQRREFAKYLTAGAAEDNPDERIERARKAYEAYGSCPIEYTVGNLVETIFPPLHLSKTRPLTEEEEAFLMHQRKGNHNQAI